MFQALLQALFVCAGAGSALAQESAARADARPAEQRTAAPRPARFALDAAATEKLFPALRANAAEDEYDAALWFRHKPGLDATKARAELPDGGWRLRTNSLGLRMDRELPLEPAEFALLLSGGANMEGACANADTIAARVERALAKEHEGATLEALSAAKSGYTLYHHALVLDRFAERRPRMLVVLVGLTDLEATLAPYYHFSGTAGPELSKLPGAEDAAYVDALARWPDAVTQGLAAVRRFKLHPRELETSLAVGSALFGELAARCAALRTELVVLWYPPFFAAAPNGALAELAEPCKQLDLSAADLASTAAIATRFLEALRGLRVTVIDLSPRFASEAEPLFWKSDHVFDATANELVAREITKRFEALVARDAVEGR